MNEDSPPRLQEIRSNTGAIACEIPGKGRGLVAGVSFVPGDVVLHERPYHAVVSTADLSTTCSAKLTHLKQRGIRCKRCKIVRCVIASPYLFFVLLNPWTERRRLFRVLAGAQRPHWPLQQLFSLNGHLAHDDNYN
jgi:hypothetical protein